MKQFFILLFVAIAFFGCSSKNENPQPKDTVLLNTKWQTQDLAAEIVWGGRWFRVLHFTSNTAYEVYKTKNGSIDSYVSEGTYTITDKKVTLVDKDSKGKETIINYTMVNSGTLECESKGQYYCTYVKQ